jgi:hypothetical protein
MGLQVRFIPDRRVAGRPYERGAHQVGERAHPFEHNGRCYFIDGSNRFYHTDHDTPITNNWTQHPDSPLFSEARFENPAGHAINRDVYVDIPLKDSQKTAGDKFRVCRLTDLSTNSVSYTELGNSPILARNRTSGQNWNSQAMYHIDYVVPDNGPSFAIDDGRGHLLDSPRTAGGPSEYLWRRRIGPSERLRRRRGRRHFQQVATRPSFTRPRLLTRGDSSIRVRGLRDPDAGILDDQGRPENRGRVEQR